MGFLGFGKKDRVLDLSGGYKKTNEVKKNNSSDSFNILSNLGYTQSGSSDSSGNSNETEQETPEEKKRKLAKMLSDMTRKLDEISTQIYHLQQRVELLERKTGVRAGT